MHSTIERGAFAIGGEIVTECPCECHAPCIICGAYDGAHDAGCMIAPCPSCGQRECRCEPDYLTPQERAALTILKRHAERDGGDNGPMQSVDYTGADPVRTVIPWLVALNLDTSTL